MRHKFSLDETARVEIACYVGPRAFAPGARTALEGLGYAVVPALSRGRFGDASWSPTVRLVDERHYDRVPSHADDPETPLVLVTSGREPAVEDARIAGHTARPIELDDLYSILQRALEQTPRATPRVPTHIAARGIREDRRWIGTITSLSMGGCFLRTRERPPVGAHLSVQFAIPNGNIVVARAICVHSGGDGIGLAFTRSSEDALRDIGHYVSERLAIL